MLSAGVSGLPSLRENTQTYVYCPLRMNRRASSKSFSGDAWTEAEGDAAGAGDATLSVVLGEPPQAAKSNATVSTSPTLFKSWRIEAFINLLVPNIHDHALRILIHNIKPAAQPRLLSKFMMRVVRKHVPRPKAIANQRPRILLLPECDPIVKSREARILVEEITRVET